MSEVTWQPVPGYPGARMVDSCTHPPIFAIDIAAADEEHRKHLARKARRMAPTEVDQGMPRSETCDPSDSDISHRRRSARCARKHAQR